MCSGFNTVGEWLCRRVSEARTSKGKVEKRMGKRKEGTKEENGRKGASM